MTEAITRPRPQIDNAEELDRVVRRLVEAFDPSPSISSAAAPEAARARMVTTI